MRVALIGFGKWGRNYLLAVNQTGKAKVTQVLVRKPDLITNPELRGLTATSNLKEIDCDAAIIATHPEAAVGYAIHFLNKKIPVMLEKPAGLSLASALRLQVTAQESMKILLVSHQHLFSNVYENLRSRIDTDEQMEIRSFAGNEGPVRDYSYIWDYAPHDLAMILGLKNSLLKVRKSFVEGTSEFVGRCKFSLTHSDGTIANSIIWNDRPPKTRYLGVKTKKLELIYDDTLQNNSLILNGKMVTVPYTPPLTNAVKAFVNAVIDGKTSDYRFGGHWATNVATIIEEIIKNKSIYAERKQ